MAQQLGKKEAEEEISVQRYMSGAVEIWKGSKRIHKFESDVEFGRYLDKMEQEIQELTELAEWYRNGWKS